MRRQLIFYHVLLEGYKKDAYTIDKAILDFIEPNKHGEYERIDFDISSEDIAEIKNTIEHLAQEVMNGTFLEKGALSVSVSPAHYINLLQNKKLLASSGTGSFLL